MSQRKGFKLFGVTISENVIVSLTEDQISENVMDQENNNDDEEHDNNQDDSDDDFVFEPLAINNNNSSSLPELELTLSMSLPWRLKKKIEDMGGHDMRKIIQKPLRKSDVNPNNNRFSFPENKIDTSFLKPQEFEVLNSTFDNNKPQGIQVLVLDSSLQEFKLILKRWRMRSCFTYNLTRGWRNVVQSNHFKQGDELQLWSFRWLDERLEEQLGFAIAKPFFNYNVIG